MPKYRYTHTVRTVIVCPDGFTWDASPGDEINRDGPIDHAYVAVIPEPPIKPVAKSDVAIEE